MLINEYDDQIPNFI